MIELKNSSVSVCSACRRLSSKSGNSCEFGCLVLRFRSCSHWPRKLSTSDCGPLIGQHPPHLTVERRRPVQRAAGRRVEQLVVRNAAPEEERQPRGEVEVGHAIGSARRESRRIALGAEDELRAGEHTPQRQIDAAVEAAAVLPALAGRSPSASRGRRSDASAR